MFRDGWSGAGFGVGDVGGDGGKRVEWVRWVGLDTAPEHRSLSLSYETCSSSGLCG